eukprot:CAMPEP_0204405082 /NCGR_PEP_ID=MMETSP0470-20130426/7101_1 /ASSEMBLY_ACC=CAM_ASM_000385 /TAXON_ID=2969 /ORGANISM="Oxyrrhis marina" /LENGTH=149 /DNA_ID=CAMNT_0051400471 /DNA_START=193 /DNA_END=638 /DNA_ORIENTATION=-
MACASTSAAKKNLPARSSRVQYHMQHAKNNFENPTSKRRMALESSKCTRRSAGATQSTNELQEIHGGTRGSRDKTGVVLVVVVVVIVLVVVIHVVVGVVVIVAAVPVFVPGFSEVFDGVTPPPLIGIHIQPHLGAPPQPRLPRRRLILL